MVSATDLAGLLPAVIDIARRAAGAILEVYDGEFAVEHKDDRSPLTAADRAAHSLIVAALEARSAGPGGVTGWSIRWTARASS